MELQSFMSIENFFFYIFNIQMRAALFEIDWAFAQPILAAIKPNLIIHFCHITIHIALA